MSRIGTRIQVEGLPVVLDRLCHLAPLKLRESQQEMCIRTLWIDPDGRIQFFECAGCIVCLEGCMGPGQVGLGLSATWPRLLCLGQREACQHLKGDETRYQQRIGASVVPDLGRARRAGLFNPGTGCSHNTVYPHP